MQETARYRIRGDESKVSELLANKKFKQARRLATKLAAREDLEQQPRNKLILQKAISELSMGKPEQAYADLHEIEGTLELLVDHLSFWMAQALENMGERRGAISAYEDFLMRSEHRALRDSVSLRLATLYVKHHSFERPLELYEETVRRSPHLIPEVLYLMGQTLEADESREAAQKKWRQLIASYPAHPRALQAVWKLPAKSGPLGAYRRAIVYYRHGQHRRAARAFRQFLTKYPKHNLASDAEYQLGRSYLGSGQYAKAEQTFSKAHRKHRIPAALYRMAGIQVRKNRDLEATGTYEKFADTYPRHELAPRALWQAAKAAERNNRFASAEQYYAALAERYPESDYREPAAWSVGFMHYCQDEYRQAMQLFGELALSMREPHLVDQSFYWAGKVGGAPEAETARPELFHQGRQRFSSLILLGARVEPGLLESDPGETASGAACTTRRYCRDRPNRIPAKSRPPARARTGSSCGGGVARGRADQHQEHRRPQGHQGPV